MFALSCKIRTAVSVPAIHTVHIISIQFNLLCFSFGHVCSVTEQHTSLFIEWKLHVGDKLLHSVQNTFYSLMTCQISNIKMPVQHFNVSKLSSDNISLCQIAKNIFYLHSVSKKDDILDLPMSVYKLVRGERATRERPKIVFVPWFRCAALRLPVAAKV